MNFKIKKTLVLVFFLLFFGKINAQTPFQIQGIVLNAQTKEPLSDVNILKEKSAGGTTNEEGFFQMEISILPSTLSFSFVGFETEFIEIKNASQREFIIELQPIASALPEVSVSSKRKVDTVFFEPFSVVDYVFFENKIFLLAHRNSIEKYSLIALDETTNEPIAEVSLKNYFPKGLLQYCTDDLFLVTEKNVRKIAIDSTGIFFPKKIRIENFYLIDHPCVLATENFLYFERYFYQGQALRYNVFARQLNAQQKNGEAPIPTDSIEKYQFPLIQNEKEIFRLIEELGLRKPWSGELWDEYLDEKILALKESDYFLKGIMKVFYPKLNAPIFQKGKELIIFNHFESELQFFSEKGDSLRSIPIDYHNTRKWKKQILFDNIQERAFTTFNTRWGEKIQEIDLEKGILKTALPIDFAYIEKPKVRNGYLYFLYKNAWAGERKLILHRMKLD
ncbi:MAG: carboxypeptidase-like regulatory domain-containing protein [Saprospiraceae bacterium]